MTWQTILVLAIIVLAVAAIVANGIRNRKKGRHSCACGSDCASCGVCGGCAAAEEEKKEK